MKVLFTCACGVNSEKLFNNLRKDFKEKIILYGVDIKNKEKKQIWISSIKFLL